MLAQPFHKEIRNLISSFVAAFDNIVINRYDSSQNIQNEIQVRYVYAPKQRVLYDLVNQAQNITLPVVAVWMTNIAYDKTRVFNKLAGFNFGNPNTPLISNYVGSPIPVNISISMSIMTKFQIDMDQILSNWAPYNNPYIILSWQIPSDFNLSSTYEIRSEVLWNGEIALEYPIELAANAKYKATANTSFTIKGWLFPPAPSSPVTNIYTISAFHHVQSILTDYETLSGQTISYPVSSGLVQETETVVLSGNPALSATPSLSSIISFII